MNNALISLKAIHSFEPSNICRFCSVAAFTVFPQAASSLRHLAIPRRHYCSSQQSTSGIPSKETLLRVDWLLEHVTPGILKSRLKPFFDICVDDVSFEDKLYNYKLSRKSQLLTHIAKIRLYYRYRSPFNKVERVGSCIYENEDVIVLLWRLSTMESSFWTYFPSFITKKEPKLITSEGALDIHVNKDGYIYKIVNRKITASDREGAKVMEAIKAEQEELRAKAEEKEMRRRAEDRMLRRFAPYSLRAAAGRSCFCRTFSADIDHSHEKPAPFQLQHIQTRLVETVPFMFKQRLDYTFYRKDVFCDDQIFGLKKHGIDQLMQHFGTISVLAQITLPHVHMETVSVIPVIDDGTVRCRWRVKYVSFPRLLMNPRLFKFDYRMKNLSWFDGYSVLTVDGNGLVFKITLQKTQRDEEVQLEEKSPKEKLAEKIAVFRPRPATNFVPRRRHMSGSEGSKRMLSRHSVRYAHAASATRAQIQKAEQISKLPNGLTVASLDRHGPITQLVLLFRAGSRYEAANEHGLVHHLRNSVGTDSARYPGLSLLWSSAVCGGRVNAFSTRDVYGVSLSLPRDETSIGISVLGHIAQPAFKPWEVEDIIPTLKTDNAYKQPYAVAYEDLHRAAYRNGSLANSVYASKNAIGRISYKTLVDFASKHLTTGQAVLYGLNIEHDRIVTYGETHAPLNNGQRLDAVPSPYKGGEWRRPAGEPLAHVLLAGEGASLNDPKAMAVQAVLLSSLGRSPAVQFSGKTANCVASKAVGTNAVVSAFQAAYENGGLGGIYIVADRANIAKAVVSAASAIKNYKCNDLEAAKNAATNEILRASAHTYPTAIDRATQILAGLTTEGAIVNAVQKGISYNEDVLKFELPSLPDPLPKFKAALEKFAAPKESDLVRRSFMPLRTHPDPLIEAYFENVTETGKSRLPWELVRPAFLWKIKSCMDEMVRWHRQREGLDSFDLSEGSENKRMYDFILDKAAKFEAAPFTWQRICELLHSPSRHYRKADKYFRALDKTINVVTTVSEDGRRMTGNPPYTSETPDVYSIEQLFFGEERADCDFWDPDFAYNAQKVTGSPNAKDQLEPLDMSRKRTYCSDEEAGPKNDESDEEMEF
ncbi:peptidase M16 inactive domain protein [Oesophagostomum dentatum]|uniref:Peptidase M16 inactive domain protein n=1 Tax=Oesophagostomum dentatum TaxID=61180 RepID=A0A0B1TUE7_OESDE|nr:peptidase M16 inactive domain protein [Oesophagostomum dentatum]